MRIPALSRVSDKKEDLHQIFIATVPRGFAPQSTTDFYSTDGKQKHEFYWKDLQFGPRTQEETAVITTHVQFFITVKQQNKKGLTPPTPSNSLNSPPTWPHDNTQSIKCPPETDAASMADGVRQRRN